MGYGLWEEDLTGRTGPPFGGASWDRVLGGLEILLF